MAVNPRGLGEKQVVLDAHLLEVNLGDNSVQATAVLEPPITQLKELKGTIQRTWKTTLRKEQADSDFDTSLARKEFDRLIARYDVYRESSSYLARLASLARVLHDDISARRFALEAEAASPAVHLRFKRADYELTHDRNVDEARATLVELANQGNIDASLRLAELCLARGETLLARATVAAALQRDSLDWRTNLLAGTMALMDGQMPRAIRFLRVATLERPNSTILFFNLAIAHYVAGNLRQAIHSIRITLGLNPFDQRALMFLLDLAPGVRQLTPVVRRLVEQFIHFAPDATAIASRAVNYFLKAKEHQEGIAALEVVANRSKDPDLVNNFGVLLAAANNPTGALHQFRRAVQLATANSPSISFVLLANLAHAYVDNDELERAERLSKEVLATRSINEVISSTQLGRMKHAELMATLFGGDYEPVIAFAQRYVDVPGIDPLLKVNLLIQLVCYHSITQDNLELATEYAISAAETLKEIPDPPELLVLTVQNNLMFCLVETGNLPAAEQVLREMKIDESRPGSSFALATRGFYHLRKREIEAGTRDYQKAINLTQKYDRKMLLRKKLEYELAVAKELESPREALIHAKRALKTGDVKIPWPSGTLDSRLHQLIGRLSRAH
jgi:tetratricopeptide (TPR) repeat protein